MPRTIGLFWWRHDDADLWFNQCDGPLGRHGGIEITHRDTRADHVVLVGPPVDGRGRPHMPALRRRLAKWRGCYDAERLEHAIDTIRRPRDDLSMLVYEPPPAFSDGWFEAARRRCRAVYAPDARATHPIILPSTWSFPEHVSRLRDEPSNSLGDNRPLPLVCVTSGKSMWKGHDARLAFLRKLRAAGVPFELFGRGLPPDLAPRGPLISKASMLRSACLTLAIENHDAGEHYVTEKLWDPLLCWSLPLYIGSAAADRVVPAGSFLRVPGFGDEAVEVVRHAVSRAADLRRARLDVIADARERGLGPLRFVEWLDAIASGRGTADWDPAPTVAPTPR